MKPSARKWLLPCICIAALTNRGTGDPVQQPAMHFTQGQQGTFNADWEGVAGRTYFMQFSQDLDIWHFAPFIHFGDGGHNRGIHSDSDRLFVRLAHEDRPGINSLEDAMNADFDGDGLSNIFEVTHGYSPYDDESTMDGPDAATDPDGDGMGNATESALGLNPLLRDNPALMLQGTAD